MIKVDLLEPNNYYLLIDPTTDEMEVIYTEESPPVSMSFLDRYICVNVIYPIPYYRGMAVKTPKITKAFILNQDELNIFEILL